MAKERFSIKRLQIDKATANMVIFTSIASAVFVFAMISTRTLLSQRSYQAKVIGIKEKARDQLKENIEAKDSLVASYQQFVATPENIIGGASSGNGQNDGDNARIILDALPSKYDFPALATSLEKIFLMTDGELQVESISGIDDEIAQAEAEVLNPEPIEMPFQAIVSGEYNSIRSLVSQFERSIRPIHVTALSLSAVGTSDTAARMRLDVSAKTYYQPEKQVNIRTEIVK